MRLEKIGLHTFRHWHGTNEYHKIKDIFHVQQRLGHRCIENTMIYITINETLYELGSDQYYSATAKTVAEASKLVETGFEYVCSFGENRLFRKRK